MAYITVGHIRLRDLREIVLNSRYLIKDFIGAGGMASVWLAVDTKLNTNVAIKVLSPENDIDINGKKRFIREIKSAMKITHQNIIAMYGYGNDIINTGDEQIEISWCVMEYCNGDNLKELQIRMEENSGKAVFEPEEALRIITDILSALTEVHTQQILHRDLKPENIMLDNTYTPPRARILDFGIARVLDEVSEQLTLAGTTLGTIEYLTPEQLEGDDEIDQRSDLYSVGVMLYEMLTGELPYEVVTGEEILTHNAPALSEQLIHNNNLRINLDRLLKKSMKKNPKERFQTAAEFIEEIETILNSPAQNTTTNCTPIIKSAESKSISTTLQKKKKISTALIIVFIICATISIGVIGYNSICKNEKNISIKNVDQKNP